MLAPNIVIEIAETDNTLSAPDNIRTAVNYGSRSSKYRSIVKTTSTEYGRF